jgi:hypothetical protein
MTVSNYWTLSYRLYQPGEILRYDFGTDIDFLDLDPRAWWISTCAFLAMVEQALVDQGRMWQTYRLWTGQGTTTLKMSCGKRSIEAVLSPVCGILDGGDNLCLVGYFRPANKEVILLRVGK